MYFQQGGVDAAFEEYKEAIRINPEDALAYCGLGKVYHRYLRFEQAIICYETFIRLALPKHASEVEKVKQSLRWIRENVGYIPDIEYEK